MKTTNKDNSHQTAIARVRISAPLRKLLTMGVIDRAFRILDYGCGKGFDVQHLRERGCSAYGYDPTFRPDYPRHTYERILCTYVLNVIPTATERLGVLKHIQTLLTPDGWAYVTVRTDTRCLRGYTAKRTWQGLITVIGAGDPITFPHFDIYRINRRMVLATTHQTF